MVFSWCNDLLLHRYYYYFMMMMMILYLSLAKKSINPT